MMLHEHAIETNFESLFFCSHRNRNRDKNCDQQKERKKERKKDRRWALIIINNNYKKSEMH